MTSYVPWPGQLVVVRTVLVVVAAATLVSVLFVSPTLVFACTLALVGAAIILRYPVIGYCLLAFAIPWGSAVPGGHSGFGSPTELIVGLLTGVWLVALVTRREHPASDAPWAPYLALFLAAIAISVTQAADVLASAREVLKWIEMAVVYLSAKSLLRTTSDLRLVLVAIVAAGVSQALLGYYQFALHAGPAAFASQRLFLRAFGTFDQPNPYAGYLNMVLPVALALALIERSGALRKVYFLSAALILGAVLASESRGALLAGLAGISVLLALFAPAWNRTIKLGLLAILLAGWAAAFGITIGPLIRVLDSIGLSGVSFGSVNDANFSAVERAAHWVAGIRMFASHPILGIGIGNYGIAYPGYHPRGWYPSLDHAHNYYINIAAEAGIAGLTAYILLVGSALWYSFVAMRYARNPIQRAAGLGTAGALIATSCHNVFDVLYVHGTAALIGLLMAATTITVRAAPSPAAEAVPARLPGRMT